MHAVTGAVVNAQFRNAFADGFDVAGIAGRLSLDAGLDARAALQVAEAIDPPHEDNGLADFDHVATVANWLQRVKFGCAAREGFNRGLFRAAQKTLGAIR